MSSLYELKQEYLRTKKAFEDSMKAALQKALEECGLADKRVRISGDTLKTWVKEQCSNTQKQEVRLRYLSNYCQRGNNTFLPEYTGKLTVASETTGVYVFSFMPDNLSAFGVKPSEAELYIRIVNDEDLKDLKAFADKWLVPYFKVV